MTARDRALRYALISRAERAAWDAWQGHKVACPVCRVARMVEPFGHSRCPVVATLRAAHHRAADAKAAAFHVTHARQRHQGVA